MDCEADGLDTLIELIYDMLKLVDPRGLPEPLVIPHRCNQALSQVARPHHFVLQRLKRLIDTLSSHSTSNTG
jgi:hypothetical protein